ncbi:MAG: hypothetical protein ACLFUH_01190 [Bacteroidales bacterium]
MPFAPFALFENTFFFLTTFVIIASLIGFSGGFELGIFSGGLMFFALSLMVDYTIYTNLMYVMLIVITILTGFKIYGMTQNDTVN